MLKQLLLIVQVFQPKHFIYMSPMKKNWESYFFTMKRQVTNDFDRHGIPLDFVWLDLETGWWSIYRVGSNDSRDNIFSDGVYSWIKNHLSCFYVCLRWSVCTKPKGMNNILHICIQTIQRIPNKMLSTYYHYFRRFWRHNICRYQYVLQYILWT